MIPILFEYDATDFTTHGIGDLIEATNCKAKVTAEGEYELSFQYPASGEMFPELQIDRIVLAKVNDYQDLQRFRIYGVGSESKKNVTINCQHISYDLANYPVRLFKDQISPAGAVSMLRRNIVSIDPINPQAHPFTLSGYAIEDYTQRAYALGEYSLHDGGGDLGKCTWQCVEAIPTGEAWNSDHWNILKKFEVNEPRSARNILLDGSDSILGHWGGDLVIDNLSLSIVKDAGEERKALNHVIEYGVDLIDLKQEKNISERVTGILPYWKGTIRGATSSDYYVSSVSSGFEPGVKYFERNANYSQTADVSRQLRKTYYISLSGVFVPATDAQMDFLSGVTYYEYKAVIDQDTGLARMEYVQTEDTHYNPLTSYYRKNGQVYEPIVSADLGFDSRKVYFEETSHSFTPTADATPQAGKTYYRYETNAYSEEEEIIYGDIQYCEGARQLSQAAQKIEAVDLSEFFDAETNEQLPSKDAINKKARHYMIVNNVGEPTVDLTVSYANMGQDIRLHDTVTVRFVKLGVDAKAKVTSFTYDVLNERCTQIEVANEKAVSAWSALEDASRLRKGTLSTDRIADKSLTSEKYGTGSVGSKAIGTTAVHDWHIGNEDITTRTIAKDAVVEEKIKDTSVTVNKIKDGSIITEKIAPNAVTTSKVLNEAITLAKMWGDFQVFYMDIIAALAIFSDYVKVTRSLECAVLYVRNSQIVMGATGSGEIYEPKHYQFHANPTISGGAYSIDHHKYTRSLDENGDFFYYTTSLNGSAPSLKTNTINLYCIGKRV